VSIEDTPARGKLRPTVLITGASSGLGRALALDLARDHRVFATVRRAEDAASLLAAEPQLEVLRLDVTDGAEIHATAEAITSLVGDAGLQAVIHNAGLAYVAPLSEIDPANLRHQLEVNIVAVVALTQALLPLLEQGRGRIVTVGSTSGRTTIPFVGPYSASKHALVAVSRALRMELRPWRIPVIHLELGNLRTPIWDKGDADLDRLARSPRYGRYARAVRRDLRRSVRLAAPVERGVRAIRRALVAPRPPRVLRVGIDAHLLWLAERILPDALREAFLVRLLGLHAKQAPAPRSSGTTQQSDALDTVYAAHDTTLDPGLAAAQSEVLEDEAW
jgi:NAD(P)-dependent dehydrogenase (short-subunit alcohol dehydrogenase family)